MFLPERGTKRLARKTGASLAYSNVGARLGVLGTPIEVKDPTPQLVEALASMRVRVFDQDGKEIDAGKGSDILGQPLNLVLWLAKGLKSTGAALKKGDLLSLGSFSKLMPPKSGTGAKVVYEGLPGNPSVSVRFK